MHSKRLFYNILICSSFALLAVNCSPIKPTQKKKAIKTLASGKKEENFEKFKDLFFSDSLFQINRIIFPLENELKIDKEYAAALKDSDKITIDDNNYVPYNKNNWAMLKDVFFKKNDSIAITAIAKEIHKAFETSSATSAVDFDRVSAVKKALADGSYSINAERVAKKLIQFEKLLPKDNSS